MSDWDSNDGINNTWGKTENDRKRNTILLIITVILGSGACIWALFWLTTLPPTVTYTNVYSLSDGTSIHGSFMLGSGYISSKPVYFYFAESATGHGGYIRLSVPADSTIIYMDQDAYPYLRTTSYLFDTGTSYEFHVPRGSVVPTFAV